MRQEEIEKLRKEADLHSEDDRKKKELVEVKNVADNLVYVAEKSLREWGDKVNEELKKKISEAIENVKKTKEASEDVANIKQASQELSQILQEVGKQMYEKQQPGPAGQSEAGQPEGTDSEKPENGGQPKA